MAPKKKNTTVEKAPEINHDLLKIIVDATSSTAGMHFACVHDFAHLEAAGLVESNSDIQNEDGDTAVRGTMAGFDLIYPDGAPEPVSPEPVTPAISPATTPKGKTMFQIEENIPMPTKTVKRGRATGSSKYPFEQLQVGQCFRVPATEKMPDPAKSLASAVAAAIRKFAVASGTKQHKGKEVTAYEPTRVFEVRAIEGGAGVWRTK